MADYRNLPFAFDFLGTNIVSDPHLLKPGEYTKMQNVRYRRLGVLEARYGTEDFTQFFTQKQVAAVNTYPSQWNIGDLLKAHYIGKIYNNATAIDGWVTFHAAGTGTGNANGYRVFINGVPVAEMESGCGFTTPFIPVGFSVVRTTSKTGRPILILDGTHFVILRDCDLTVPNETLLSYTWGTGAGNYPIFYAYKLGIAETTGAPTTANDGIGNLTGNYFWAITYQNSKTGFESPLGAFTPQHAASSNKVDLGTISISTNPQVDKIRIWRKGGTLTNSWRLVTTLVNNPCVGGTTSYEDNTADSTLAVAEALATDTDPPFTSVDKNGATVTRQEFTRCWGPFLGKFQFWVGDPIKPGYIYWNVAGDASQYKPIDSVTSVSDPGEELQNGFVFSSLPFVFSKLNLYAMDYGGPEALPEFTPRLISIGLGLAGKWAYAVAPNVVYFLGRDGIYATDCQPGAPLSLTESKLKPIFQGRAVGDFDPIDWTQVDTARMCASSRELHFFYIGVDTDWHHLVYDIEHGAWTRWSDDVYRNGYADEGNSTLRLIFGKLGTNSLYSIDDARPDSGAETFEVSVRTNSFDSQIPLTYKEYGTLMMDADCDAQTLTIVPYYSGETETGSTITMTPDSPEPGRQDYSYTLGDYYARSIALDISWTESPGNHPILYGGTFLFREDEERVGHWEMPATAFGNGGWFHLKDAYFCLRSNDPITLTVVIDNTITDTYTIASTAGARLKQYVEFKPRRGKVYQLKLDTTSPTQPGGGTTYVRGRPFRFYGEDSLLRGKPWITGATYQDLQPFGAVGYAQYRRTEGGT